MREKVPTSVCLDSGLHKVLKVLVAVEGKSLSDLFSELATDYLKATYGEDTIEALKKCQDPIEGIAIISAAQVRRGENVDNTLLAIFERITRERSV